MIPSDKFQSHLNKIKNAQLHLSLNQIQRGIEKESLRIDANGRVAQTAHPTALGSALTHPQITTDYSEALLEFITGVHTSIDDCLNELYDIHQFTFENIGDEMLWTASMPCFIASDKDVPIAQYGSSNIGHMKHVYRIGLEHRYGRIMQAIAGIHYNFSLSQQFWENYQRLLGNQDTLQHFINTQYLHLIRNFQRHAWLLVYLFGASPAICESFVKTRKHQLSKLQNGDLGHKNGTCLRMSNLGYQSSAQDDLIATYNATDEYIQTLLQALISKHDNYEAIGLKDVNGAYKQLSTHLLQIENEFYSIIRPKTVTHSGEPPLNALKERGIEYIEVRCLDLNPMLPLGIDAQQIRLIDSFLLYCLFSPSPAMTKNDIQKCRHDFQQVVTNGLDTKTVLSSGTLEQCATTLLDDIEQVSTLLDQAHQSTDYSTALSTQREKVKDSNLCPAGQIIGHLIGSEGNHQHFHHWALTQSEKTKQHFSHTTLSAEQKNHFAQAAEKSLQKQTEIEQQDEIDFDTFLQNFYLQYQRL